ncbi:MAG: Rdx family protein [Dehalococcoidia bacterium]
MPEAVSMTEEVMREYEYDIESFKLITGGGGKFEVSIDSETVFSKLETGRFPDASEIKDAIKMRLEAASPA